MSELSQFKERLERATSGSGANDVVAKPVRSTTDPALSMTDMPSLSTSSLLMPRHIEWRKQSPETATTTASIRASAMETPTPASLNKAGGDTARARRPSTTTLPSAPSSTDSITGRSKISLQAPIRFDPNALLEDSDDSENEIDGKSHGAAVAAKKVASSASKDPSWNQGRSTGYFPQKRSSLSSVLEPSVASTMPTSTQASSVTAKPRQPQQQQPQRSSRMQSAQVSSSPPLPSAVPHADTAAPPASVGHPSGLMESVSIDSKPHHMAKLYPTKLPAGQRQPLAMATGDSMTPRHAGNTSAVSSARSYTASATLNSSAIASTPASQHLSATHGDIQQPSNISYSSRSSTLVSQQPQQQQQQSGAHSNDAQYASNVPAGYGAQRRASQTHGEATPFLPSLSEAGSGSAALVQCAPVQPPASQSTSSVSEPSAQSSSYSNFDGGLFSKISPITVSGKQYLRLSTIGKGGCGKVYRGLSASMDLVAIKHVDVGEEAGAECREELIESCLNEIRTLEQLQHSDHVVKLHSWELSPDRLNILMIMDCGDYDLATFLQRQSRYLVHYVDVLWIQMLNCVRVIHEQRIVHSDLKPANFVFFSGFLKLIDFGIAAKLIGDVTSIARDSRMGTPNYMAPETIRAQGSGSLCKANPKSDVWSLGCILYRMVYNRTPFQHLPDPIAKFCAIVDDRQDISFPVIRSTTTLSVLKKCLTRNVRTRVSVDDLLGTPLNYASQTQQGAPVTNQTSAASVPPSSTTPSVPSLSAKSTRTVTATGTLPRKEVPSLVSALGPSSRHPPLQPSSKQNVQQFLNSLETKKTSTASR